MVRPNKNIIWIVIDTLRSDMLASCLSDTAEPNEIDEIIEKGVLFTDVMTSGASTRISAPSYFTSLRPGLSGMTKHGIKSIRSFKDDALTVTEYFKHYGYQTFRWDDSSLDSCQPKRGFDVFESGYPTVDHTPHKNYDNARRDAFIKQLRESRKPFFANIHLDYIHDFGGIQKDHWTTAEYLRVVSSMGSDLKALWDKLEPGADDIVVVTSDHGCILNKQYIDHDREHPWDFSLGRTRVFASFIAEGLTPAKKHKLIRSIDIAPTLLDLAVGEKMHAHGISLVPVLHGSPEPELIGLAERNHSKEYSSITQYACVRKNNWALNFNEGKPVGLYNFDEGDYAGNHIGTGLEIEQELLTFYTDTVLKGPQSAAELYNQNGISISDFRGEFEASILLPVFDWSDKVRLSIDSLLDQVLLTELIVLDADKSGTVETAIQENFSDRLFLRHLKTEDNDLRAMLNAGLESASAPFTVTATADCEYTENLCYSLRKAFLQTPNTVLAYPNLKRLISDNRNIEYIGNEDCFDEILFSRLGSGFEHRSNSAAYSLPHFNEIGACAMFETETLRKTGGFSENSSDPLAETWFKLGRQGKIRHINKGLVISRDTTILRPRIQQAEAGHEFQISVLVPLSGPEKNRELPIFLAMLTAQNISGMEVLLLNPSENDDFYIGLAEKFNTLNMRTINRPGTVCERLNSGIYAARGKYLFWSEPEDRLLPNCLSTLLDKIEQDESTTAVQCAYYQTSGGEKQTVRPLGQVREMLREICDLRGLLYQRRLHNDAGIFKPSHEEEPCWDMCIRLAMIAPFETIEEPLFITSGNQLSIEPTLKSYHRVLRSTINSMGGRIDLVRLYEEDFRRHQADKARFILEDEMLLTLELINKSGIHSGGMLRVPKTY